MLSLLDSVFDGVSRACSLSGLDGSSMSSFEFPAMGSHWHAAASGSVAQPVSLSLGLGR